MSLNSLANKLSNLSRRSGELAQLCRQKKQRPVVGDLKVLTRLAIDIEKHLHALNLGVNQQHISNGSLPSLSMSNISRTEYVEDSNER